MNQRTVVHAGGGIAGKEKIVERFEQVTTFLKTFRIPTGTVTETLNQFTCQLLGRMRQQFIRQKLTTINGTALSHQRFCNCRLCQHLRQQVAHLIGAGALLEHTTEIAVLVRHNIVVEDVAVQSLTRILRSHGLYLGAGSVQQHCVQSTNFRIESDGYLFLCHKFAL